MRITHTDDLKKLGAHARRQIEAALAKDGAAKQSAHQKKQPAELLDSPSTAAKKTPPARVKRTDDGLAYCPYPSPDPFVQVHQRLEAAYGRYEDGGLLLSEMIVEGGSSLWRFDFALLSPFQAVMLKNCDDSTSQQVLLGNNLVLIEADGFGPHKSKDAFKNDRAKQTHALKNQFVVKRITNADARQRLDEVMADIDVILSQRRIYTTQYKIRAKGHTQSVFSWEFPDIDA